MNMDYNTLCMLNNQTILWNASNDYVYYYHIHNHLVEIEKCY